MKLYIIPGVPTETLMCPQTRKEISSIGWIRLTDLPGYSKKNKNVHPGIKLYMVTPFLAGLRKWISQNIRRRGKLLPVVEEDGNEGYYGGPDTGPSDELVAMLRKSQPTDNKQVDLMGMLRNGTTSMVPEATNQQPQPGQQDLLAMLKQPKTSLPNDATTAANQSQSLLDILKSPPPVTSPPSMHPFATEDHVPTRQRHHHIPLGDLETTTLPASAPESTPETAHQSALLSSLNGHHTVQPHTTSSITSHQSDLLSLLKSPKMVTAETPKVSSHQSALLATLKSPPVSKSVPANVPQPTSSNIQSGNSQSPASLGHRDSLLARLKSPVIPNVTPAVAPIAPAPTVAKAPVAPSSSVQSHQNALLSALKSPPLAKTQPPVPTIDSSQTEKKSVRKRHEPPVATASQSSLLSSLKGPAPEPSQEPAAPNSHQSSLLAAFKSPPILKAAPSPVMSTKPAPLSLRKDQAPPLPVEAVYSPTRRTSIASPPLPQSPPSPEHKASLLSALKSPTLPAAKSLFDGMKSPTFPENHTSSLLAAFKNPAKETPMEVRRSSITSDTKQGIRSVHMEALLKTLTSPSASPVLEKSVPVLEAAMTRENIDGAPQPTKEPLVNEPPKTEITRNGEGAGKDFHKDSLLAALKGAIRPAPAPVAPAPASLLSILKPGHVKGKTPSPPAASQLNGPSSVDRTKDVSSGIPAKRETATKPLSTSSLFETLKGKPTRVSSPPSRSRSPNTPAAATKTESPSQPAPSKQFDFSPSRQVGKRMRYRQVLTPTAAKEIDNEQLTEPKPNGAIDLSKITLLKRHPMPESSAPSEPVTSEKIEDVIKQAIGRSEDMPVTPTAREVAVEANTESPLGIEFPFKRRSTPKSATASPSPTPKGNVQSLLSLLKPSPTAQVEVTPEVVKDTGTVVELEDKPEEQPPKEDKIQSLLRAFRSTIKDEPIPPTQIKESQSLQQEPTKEEETIEEHVDTKREMKLLAMLERALSKGV